MILDNNVSFLMKFFRNSITTIQHMALLLPFDCKVARRIFILIIVTVIIYHLIYNKHSSEVKKIVSNRSTMEQNREYLLKNTFKTSPDVHIIDLTAPIKTKFQCIKTKKLLNNLSTNICLHQTKKDMYISGAFHDSTAIWEEEQVTHILQLLSRHPHLHFIDIGANIGSYTMFVAALGRFVLAIDCFAPNLLRLSRAIQLSNLSHQVVLVQNALFTHSGRSLRLSVDTTNIGGQGISLSSNHSEKHRARNNFSTKNPYVVKTITFDEVLPILVARGIRGALVKMDIEGSESFVVESGSHVFDTLNIPFIQMEWKIVRRYTDRVKIILDFFDKRSYDPKTSLCQPLSLQEHKQWPDEIYWLKKNTSNFC